VYRWEAAMADKYKHDVFISYFHEDETVARQLFERLQDCGLRVFWSPKTLERGVGFPEPLANSVDSSQHFALYWSLKTHESKWVLKEAEIFLRCHLADKARRRMYVVLEDSCSPDDLPMILRDLNRPSSIDELVTEVVKIVLSDYKQQCHDVITAKDHRVTELKEKISGLEEDLKQAKLKVGEAQDYYRYNRFWGPISKTRDVHIFTCARDLAYDPKSSRGDGGRTNIDLWDYRAVLDITRFLAGTFPHVKVTIEDPISKLHGNDLEKPARLADRMSQMRSVIENKDCIIIGSPDVNDFAEIVLAAIHGIDPYTEGRQKKKGFVIIKEHKGTKSSFYWQKEKHEQEGVAQVQGPSKYRYFANEPGAEAVAAGRMFGILVVANNPFHHSSDHEKNNGTETRRKVIILSGFSGVATNAMAKLLTDEKYLSTFFDLDNKYADTNKDIEALIRVEYDVDEGFSNRDTRRIVNDSRSIALEVLVEV
jgi:hypothetical protein